MCGSGLGPQRRHSQLTPNEKPTTLPKGSDDLAFVKLPAVLHLGVISNVATHMGYQCRRRIRRRLGRGFRTSLALAPQDTCRNRLRGIAGRNIGRYVEPAADKRVPRERLSRRR